MKCVIGVSSLKILSRIIRFLARLSNEIYLEAKDDCLHLKVINNSKTAYSDVVFPKTFFSVYRCNGDEFEDNNCRLSAKPLLEIFKGVKSINSCKIELDAVNCRVLVEFTNKKLTKTTHSVSILEHENLENFTLSDSYPNTIVSSSRTLLSVLDNFPATVREICVEAVKEKLCIKNHIDHPEKDVETVRLKWGIKDTEFTKYQIEENSQVIFTLQDFKSIVQLADGYEASLKIDFSEEGDPIVISMQNEANFQTILVLATLKETDLRNSRKPKNITNYRALLGSFIASNKRKSAGDALNKSIEAVRQKKTTNRKENRNQPAQLPPRAPSYTESELKSMMKSPDISVCSSMKSQSNKRKSSDKSEQQPIQTPSGSARSVSEVSKKRKTREKTQDRVEIDQDNIDQSVSTNHNFLNGFQNAVLNSRNLQETNDSIEEDDMLIVDPVVGKSPLIPNPLPHIESEMLAPLLPKKTSAPLFDTSSDHRSTPINSSDRMRYKVANQRAKKIFYNVLRSNPVCADEGAEILVPNSDEEDE